MQPGDASTNLNTLRAGTEPRIAPTKSRKIPLAFDNALYQTRHKIENLFAKLKD
jgi:hypothetical protein